jgi:hypothetical protein
MWIALCLRFDAVPDSTLLTPDQAIALACRAARTLGLDVADARVVRLRSSAHVLLPAAGAIARVEAPGYEDLARRQALLAEYLWSCSAPVAELIRPGEQPFILETGSVVVWRRIQNTGTPSPGDLGRALRAFHGSGGHAFPPSLPIIDPLGRIHKSLDRITPWGDTDVLNALRNLAARYEGGWTSAVEGDPLGTATVHGDVHLENVICTESGLILIDLEDSGLGPASWDFAPLAVGVERYGLSPAVYEGVLEGYATDPGEAQGFELMCRVYELLVTAWAVECSPSSPRMAEEAALRVDTLLGRRSANWTQV